MSNNDDRDIGPAILIGIATAIVSFVPAVGAYEFAMRLIRPQRHAEEAMGRGLEALFIGGPALTLVVSVFAGWMAWRCRRRIGTGHALVAIVVAVVIAALTTRYVAL